MPDLSAFTEIGLLFLDGNTPLAERIYDSIWANLGTQFGRDGHTDAKVYAWSLGMARALRASQIVEEQLDPSAIYDLLTARELEYGIIVAPTATLAERRGELAASMFLARGGTYGNISQALADMIGSAFVAYQTTSKSIATSYPTSPPGLAGNFQKPKVKRGIYQITEPIIVTGTTISVAYTPLDASQPALRYRDKIVIEPEHTDLAERVTVLSGTTTTSLQIACSLPHTSGCFVTTAPWPLWLSTKRYSYIQLTTAGAYDAETRRKVHALMGKMARGVSTWRIVTDLAPFLLDDSSLDFTAL